MGDVQHGAAGGFVHAAALHAHEAVFHHVEAADAVPARNLVQGHDHFTGSEAFAVEGDGVALFKADGDVFRFVGSLFHRHGHDVAVGAGFFPRVFEFAAFKGAVQHVAVHAVMLVGGIDRNAVLFGKGGQSGTAHEVPFTPGSDDLKVGSQSVDGKLEADLVVALAGSAVGDGHRAFLTGDFHETLGNERTGDGGAHEVAPFVGGAGTQHGIDVIACELVAQVFNIGLGRAGLQGLGFHAVEVVFLTEVGGDGNDLIAALHDEPLEDDGSIEPAGIRKDHFIVLSHGKTSQAKRAHG